MIAGDQSAAPSQEGTSAPTSADLAEEEELDMEEVLGGKIRKAPAAAVSPTDVPTDVAELKASH